MPVDLLTTAFVPPLEIRTKKCLTNKDQSRKKWTLVTEPDDLGWRSLFYIKNSAGTKYDQLRIPPIEDVTKPVYLLEYATEWDTEGAEHFPECHVGIAEKVLREGA